MGFAVEASYLTVMYSLTYGYARSIAWTVSFLSTFFQDAGIFEPMKVMVVAAFVTFVAGVHARPKVPDSQTLNKGKFTKRLYSYLTTLIQNAEQIYCWYTFDFKPVGVAVTSGH